MPQFFKGARIFDGNQILEKNGVLVDRGIVKSLLPEEHAPKNAEVIELDPHSILSPGFLDLQVNGAGGVLFNEHPTLEAICIIIESMRRYGVTGILPTLITDNKTRLSQACGAITEALTSKVSGVLGLHAEGPFISVERKGVHNPSFIRKPEESDIAQLCEFAKKISKDNGRLLLTVAPENITNNILLKLAQNSVIIAAGHTAATYERIEEALSKGVSGFTHLGNAMPPIQNRAPGPVCAALTAEHAFCGLIADGFHVHPGLMKMMLATKPKGYIFLVTDAMPPVGTTMQTFELYGEKIYRKEGRLTTADGILAGADIDMATAVRNCIHMLGVSLEEALRMASLYPATYLGLSKIYGRIAAGYAANFVQITEDVEPIETFVGGRSVWSQKAS